MLQRTASIKSHEAFSTYMHRFLYAMGSLETCSTCKQIDPSQYQNENFDLSWTQNPKFSEDLRSILKYIENNRFQGNHHYITKSKGQLFEPNSESQDYDFLWKEKNARLLPLFRFWNYIEYFAPYKYLTDQSWDDALKELIPVFLEAETLLDFHLAMLQMVVKVDDTHTGLLTNVIDEMPYYNYLPAQFEVVENQVVITKLIDESKAQMADLKVGDIITKVNGQSAMSVHEKNKKYIWGSNNAVKDRSIYQTLFMGIEGPISLELRRGYDQISGSYTLYRRNELNYEKESNGEKWKTLIDSITFAYTSYDALGSAAQPIDSTVAISVGYVDLGQVRVSDVDAMMTELSETEAIVFDVRNFPNGTYNAIANYLKPEATPFVTFTKPDFSYPGRFRWDGERSCGKTNPDYYKGKVILLVNEKTQSQGEVTCMCLQTAPNVITIGGQTAGTNSNVTELKILQRYRTSLSAMGVYYPDSRPTQRAGVDRDVEVLPRLASVREGRDLLMEKAMEVVKLEAIDRLEKLTQSQESGDY